MSEPLWVIYGLRSKDNPGFRYVGKTSWGIHHRLQQHLSDARRGVNNRRVTNWMNSVGLSNVTAVILEVCPEGDLRYLNYAERYWISELKLLGHSLTNHTAGGDGTVGYTMSEEAKQRMSESKVGLLTGEKNGMYGRTGQLHPMFGRTGENHPGIENIRLRTKTRVLTDEGRRKISEASKRPKSEETKQKMRVPKSEETKRKIKHSQHLNYHVSRDIINERCIFCIPNYSE